MGFASTIFFFPSGLATGPTQEGGSLSACGEHCLSTSLGCVRGFGEKHLFVVLSYRAVGIVTAA